MRPGRAKKLTPCMEFHVVSVICLEAHSDSHSGWVPWWQVSNFNEGIEQLTPWMEYHGRKSVIQMKAKGCTASATHSLDRVSWPQVSYSNGGQEQLTFWMRIHGSMSVTQMEARS